MKSTAVAPAVGERGAGIEAIKALERGKAGIRKVKDLVGM